LTQNETKQVHLIL